jgi:hypothetical protein
VRLARPELSQPEWKNTGIVGEPLTLSVRCGGDIKENDAVIFSVYPEGALPAQDAPLAELAAANEGGRASAKWIWRYTHDPQNPLREKPAFFFTARGRRCKTVTSARTVMAQTIAIRVVNAAGEAMPELPYKLYKENEKAREGASAEDGWIREEDLIPGGYHIVISQKGDKNE